MRPAERGQALLETTIFLPIFLLALFGLVWAVRQGALAERVQLGVRYGGVISTLANPYDSYSLYALYATIDGHPPTGPVTPGSPAPCIAPSLPEVTSGRASFWSPAAPAQGNCIGAATTLSSPEPYSQPVLIQSNFNWIAAQAPAGGYLAAGMFANGGGGDGPPGVVAQQNFFRSPDVGTLVQCTTGGTLIKESLEPAQDTSSPTPATPLPQTVPYVTVFEAGNTCSTFGPVPTAPPPSAPPPTPTPTPTPVPTATPSPSPTPAATATSPPTPTPPATTPPTPTPVPTATAVPTSAPSPTPPPGGGF